MQFHRDGFRPGDPRLKPAAPARDHEQSELPDKLDVLIVGSGPAGLALAAQLAVFPEIQTRIVEQKDGPMLLGQADGVSCRTMEMFNAFGFGQRVMEEGYWVNEATFWIPDPDHPENITRIGRVQDVEDDLSEMPHIILNQARIHDYFLELMQQSPCRLDVDYRYRLVGLEVNRNTADYPVTVTLERSGNDDTAETKTVTARYVVGCDGAGSRVRTAIGRELKGDYAYQAWGVMDVLAVTDFPDIRFKSIIKSASEGNILIIPREGGYLVRIYVELGSLSERGESRDTTLELVIDATRRIFHPFSFDVKDVAWWSVYEIGHSVTDGFDDILESETAHRTPRVFIAGDACHTHSAKAGQGMNVSMGDTFNLGWKLISVLMGKSPPDLLHSYSTERLGVARDLIDFDHEWSRVMSAPPEEAESDDKTPLVQKHFVAGGRFTAGLSVKYKPSRLIGEPVWQSLATGFEIGARFHSAPVIRLSDAKPVHIGHVIQIDARWNLFAFAGKGDPLSQTAGVADLCDFLQNSPDSPIVRYTPSGDDVDSVISLYGVFQQGHRELMFEAMPDILKPLKGKLQLKDYEKIFCADPRPGCDIYDMRGVDRKRGCLVVVRPDQYVAHILPLDGHEELGRFFAGILQARNS